MRNWILAAAAIFLAACACGTEPATTQGAGELTLDGYDKAISEAVTGRLEKLQNVTAEFSQRTESPGRTPERDFLPGAVQRNGGWEKPITAIAETDRSFSFLSGAARYESRLTPETVKRVQALDFFAPAYVLETFTDRWHATLEDSIDVDRNQWPVKVGWKRSGSMVAGGRRSAEESIIEVGLGLRPMHLTGPDNAPPWLTADRLKRMSLQTVEKDRIALQEAAPWSTAIYTWVLDRKLGWAVLSCTENDPEEQHVLATLENEDFRTVDGLIMPFKMTEVDYVHDTAGQWSISSTSVLTLRSYAVGDAHNALSRYAIAWPDKGIEVKVYWNQDGKSLDGVVRTDRSGQILDEKTIERTITQGKAEMGTGATVR